MRTATFPMLALTAALAGCGATPAPTPADPRPTRAQAAPEQRLDSGLRWALERTPGAPAVAVQLWLPAGAMHDPIDHPGIAALVAATAGARLADDIRRMGGQADGSARVDATVLSLTVAPERLEAALEALARVVSTPPAEADVRAARSRFEAQITGASRDDERRALRRLLALAWATHPGARPLLGVDVPPDAAAETWRAAHLRPAGAMLVVAGDVDDPREVIDAALGGWVGAPPKSTWTAPTLPAKGPVVQVDERPGERAAIRLAWPLTLPDAEATARADVLARAITEGSEAPLPAALSRAGIDATSDAFVFAPGPDGLLIVRVDAPAEDVDAAWRAVAEALDHVRRHPPTRALIARVVDGFESARARAAAEPAALATWVGPRALRWPGDSQRWLAATTAVTPELLAPLARTLTPRKMIAWLGTPLPDGLDGGLWGERLAEAFTAERAPAGLASGFPGVIGQVVPRPGAGTVALAVRSPGGASTVPPDMLGAAELSARALAAPLPGLGRPRVELAPDALTVTLTVPAERFAEAAGALFERLLRPTWTGERVETARAEAQSALRGADPLPAVERLLRADLARVAGAPTAEPEAVQAGLETIPPARVAAWFDGFVSHGPLRVVAVGDLDEGALYRALSAAVPAVRPGVEMQPLRPAEAVGGVHRVDRRVDGERAAWAIGWPLGKLSDAQLAASEVALALVARGAQLDVAPLRVRLLVDSRAQSAAVGLVIGGPAEAVRAAVPRVFAALSERRQIAARPEESTAAIRWLEGRRTVQLADAGALAAWIAAQADAGRTFVGPRALNQWQAEVERARGAQTLDATRAHLGLGGRLEAWVGPGAAPTTPEAPEAPPPAAPAPTKGATP